MSVAAVTAPTPLRYSRFVSEPLTQLRPTGCVEVLPPKWLNASFIVAFAAFEWQYVHPKFAGTVPPLYSFISGRSGTSRAMRLVLSSASWLSSEWQP